MFRITLAVLATLSLTQISLADSFPVTVTVDASQTLGTLKPTWRFFGYDECNFTYMPGGKELLSKLGQLGSDQVYIRCHHLLTSGDGTPGMKWGSTGIYHEDADGKPVYDFTIVDRIFDTYEQAHLKPYVQLGFMPKDLSSRPDLYPTKIDLNTRVDAAAGQAYPPKDYKKWGDLCNAWVAHCIERYGKDEVQQWYWEVWNEPNISYWRGTPEQYYQLYDYAVDGVRRALPTARVGGNESAANARSLAAFLKHCVSGKNFVTGQSGSPVDFISFHAKGSPTAQQGHVMMGISNQLKAIDQCFAAIEAEPTMKDKPIVIGESDPDGMAARPVSENAGLGYRNTPQFAAYTAACLEREYELEQKHGVNLLGALNWSFEFEGKPFFAGFRTLSTNGIDLPFFNLFKMTSQMHGTRVKLTSNANPGVDSDVSGGVRSDAAEVFGYASQDTGNKLNVLLYHYHDADVADAPSADVTLQLAGLSGDMKMTQYRIDTQHSDAYTVWQKMGAPQQPTAEQYAQLKQAGDLAQLGEAQVVHVEGGKAQVQINLPRESVALLVLTGN